MYLKSGERPDGTSNITAYVQVRTPFNLRRRQNNGVAVGDEDGRR